MIWLAFFSEKKTSYRLWGAVLMFAGAMIIAIY